MSYDPLLVSCAYEKLDRPAEPQDLYISERFRLARRYAEQRSQPWFILSGEHALVRPVDWLAPYDTSLDDMPPEYQSAWGAWVVAKLSRVYGNLDGSLVEIHAPQSYVDPIATDRAAAERGEEWLRRSDRVSSAAGYDEPDRLGRIHAWTEAHTARTAVELQRAGEAGWRIEHIDASGSLQATLSRALHAVAPVTSPEV